MSRQLPILIIGLPLMACLLITLSGFRYRRTGQVLALAALWLCFAGAALVFVHVLDAGFMEYRLGGWPPPFGIVFRVDTLGGFMLAFIAFLGAVNAIWAKESVAEELPGQEGLFWGLYLLLCTGLFGMIVTGDLFNLFVLVEVASLTSYALVAAGGGNGAVAGLKYLLVGTVGACFYLLGVGYLYLVAGTLNMTDLARLLPDIYDSRTVVTAFVFIVTGLAIKIALFPFHAWQPDAYTHAPSAVSLIISTAVAKTFVYALVRVIFSVFTPAFVRTVAPMVEVLAWLGAAAILAGSLFAIVQDDVKRLLAYSSIANVGYIVMGLGLSVSSRLGLIPVLVHTVNHAVIKGAMFMAVCGFVHNLGLRRVSRAEGLSRAMPYSVLILVLSALSMIGLPPGAGFVSKWYLMRAALECGQYPFVGVMFVSTLLMLAYFWRLIEVMYIMPGSGDVPPPGEVPPTMLIPGLAMAGLTFILGLVWLSGMLTPILEQMNLELGLGAVGRLP